MLVNMQISLMQGLFQYADKPDAGVVYITDVCIITNGHNVLILSQK